MIMIVIITTILKGTKDEIRKMKKKPYQVGKYGEGEKEKEKQRDKVHPS